ncbi:MAG: response regulator [Opitutales bacterium]|nr:response regulator [Opitutales bacterium]
MSGPKPKVLFVDDEEAILKAFKLNLGRKYSVFIAESGSEGLRIIEEDGPFKVIVSDFSMPGMNGADFLEKVREQNKEVVTMLLTGQANFDDLCDVVRRGEIFRLLGKPCSPEALDENLQQALRQHQLICAEKELLEKTLNGAIGAITSLLSAANPLFFGRAQRVKSLAIEVARELKIDHGWRLQVAADFCYLGYLTLPHDSQQNVYDGGELTPEMQKVVVSFPTFVSNLLKDIPRLNRIRKIIEFIQADFEDNTGEFHVERRIASIIRLAQEYDKYETKGCSKGEIFENLRILGTIFLPGSLDALANTRELHGGFMEPSKVSPANLKPGMRLMEELVLSDGKMLAPLGSIVSLSFIQMVQSHLAALGEAVFPETIEVLA